jgi:hypothetical protein
VESSLEAIRRDKEWVHWELLSFGYGTSLAGGSDIDSYYVK